MKVLYLLWNYPQLSETYVAAEIGFVQSQGVEVAVWSPIVQNIAVEPQCPVHRRTLDLAIEKFAPDLVHIHYLIMADRHVSLLPAGLPVTVRSHSFDWYPEDCRRIAALPSVKKIYAFPHFAREVQDPKIVPLPVAYSRERYQEVRYKDRKLVARVAAGLPTKGLADFYQVADELHGFRFVLGVARAGGAEKYPDELRAMNNRDRVALCVDLSWDEAADIVSQAGIYMDTSDPKGHRFGMPISIAEALATGSYVVARRSPAAEEFLGDAGACYGSVTEAAALIRATESWGQDRWQEVMGRALSRARLFQDDVVLPRLVSDWRGILGLPPTTPLEQTRGTA